MIYDRTGNRKYLTRDERLRFIRAAQDQSGLVETFCLTLTYTGARISEVLALRVANVYLTGGLITIESLKKRRKGVFRQIPVPDQLLNRLENEHMLTKAYPNARLWTWSRTTAWKLVKSVMEDAAVPSFCATPRALRHAFGVIGVAEAQVPLHMVQKWLGHSRIETTAIYANAVGAEERSIAHRMWN